MFGSPHLHNFIRQITASRCRVGRSERLIFLFVYDVWVELWGQRFADEQVSIESLRKGIVDYEGIWKKTLALPAAERARRTREFRFATQIT